MYFDKLAIFRSYIDFSVIICYTKNDDISVDKNNNMFEKELEKAGLTDKEANVYLAVLELGEANIARIAKKSKVKRATVYLAVESLKEKGLISAAKRENKIYYYAEDPRVIQKQLEEKKESISKIMPDLLASFAFLDKKPSIRYFEGKNGIKQVFEDMLNYPNREILAMFTEQHLDFGDNFFYEYFIPERKKRKIWVRSIFPDNVQMRDFQKNDPNHLRQSKLISSNKFTLKTEIVIYGKNKIGILSFNEELGLIIESQDIHDSLKGIFEVMWDGLG